MSNNTLLLLILAGVVAYAVFYMTDGNKKKNMKIKVSSVATPKSSPKSPKSPGKERFSYESLMEGFENPLSDSISISSSDNIETFQNPKNSKTQSPMPESVAKSAKLGGKFGGGDFQTRLTGAGGQVGPNTTNVNGLSLEGAPDYTLGVTPVISKEKKAKKLTAKDLLPKESKDDWFDMPYDKKQMMRIENENLLAGASTQSKIGIDTQGQTLKNASWDLRAAPPNPKFNVGPWNNSTIEPDYNIKPIM